MLTSELDYELPEALIAQRPAEPRDASRLMVVDAGTGEISHHVFRDLPSFLGSGDALVLNETRVLPARLTARRSGGGETELLMLRAVEAGVWEAMARPSKRLRPGMMLRVGGDEWLRVGEPVDDGRWTVEGEDILGMLERHGHMPLPPYIRPTPEAEDSYQTVYAREPGSAAAPTAGLHFTQGTLEGVRRVGAGIHSVTLHVGVGTFTPVRAANLEDHRMHAESYAVPEGTARALPEARRVVAVGTTTTRTLETFAATAERAGWADLFIYPGYRWRAVDAMITNFHLPRSTLLAMIMSFAGTDLVRRAYATAVAERYRFYSFGDAMLILNGGRNL